MSEKWNEKNSVKKDNNLREKGYKVGYFLGLTLCTCLSISIIALTIKLIMWML